jgi:2-C-methyl-D-erythritol 2,4-cyclodiphosphate synthase
MYKIGHSKDTHRLVTNRKLILGGLEIPFEFGLLGHSDADVVLHVVAESIIGALGLGDLGTFFPDTDPQYKDRRSDYFVKTVVKMMVDLGYNVNNIDITIYLEKPILKDYKPLMKNNIAKLLQIDPSLVNVKATRGEGLGYVGRMEGISAEAVVLLVSKPILKQL